MSGTLFLMSFHRKYDCKIASAHSLSDTAETVLFIKWRAALGIAGMCGIRRVRAYHTAADRLHPRGNRGVLRTARAVLCDRRSTNLSDS
jgi:hypothetical protein